ncbi:MAG TPA: hypothetical protein VGN35_07465 [Jatrophihabitantaceae bacterium]|jgi:hypothetical protein|nr:hypothetical protein [Jatrophihabitantaceae bacterium]
MITEDDLREALVLLEQLAPSRAPMPVSGDDVEADVDIVETDRPRSRRWVLAAVTASVCALVVVVAVAIAATRHSPKPASDGPTTGTVRTTVASSNPSHVPKAQPITPPPSVLQKWAGFPVNDSRRPLVLTGSPIDDPASGFPAGDAKLSYLGGHFQVATTLPTGPTSSDGYPLISALDAVSTLTSQTGKVIGGPTPPALDIVGATLGRAAFATDRGTQTLPAWRFTLATVNDPAYVLAVDPSEIWPRPVGIYPGNEQEYVQISTDRHTVTLHFIGAQPGSGPCGANYSAQAYQGRTVIAVNAKAVPQKATSGPVMCTAIGYDRTVDIRLDQPLGNRVVTDLQGNPLTAR